MTHGDSCRRLSKLGAVATRELFVPLHVMAVPAPELGARCGFFEPFVQRGVGLGDTARPQPVHEHAVALVTPEIVVVRSANTYVITLRHFDRPLYQARSVSCDG
jgi:hypothetical protein